MIQEYKRGKDSAEKDLVTEFEGEKTNASEVLKADMSPLFPSDPSYLQQWEEYVARLSAALCDFLLEAEEAKFCRIRPTISRNTISVSAVYAELSMKWFTRVLLTVFPCIRACSDQKEIPRHLRWTNQLPAVSFVLLQVYNM